MDVVLTHIQHVVHEFEDKLVIKSDLVDRFQSVLVRGRCEEAVVRYEEFSQIHLGTCPVLEQTVKTVALKNYGAWGLRLLTAVFRLRMTRQFI